MVVHLNPDYEMLRPFVEALPDGFSRGGETLHEVRNTIRAFETCGFRIVVKRFARPGPIRAFLYTYVRRSKARRAYEHALRLLAAGIDTPAPVAWCECRSRGLITDSFLVTLRSDLAHLARAAARFPAPDARPELDAFARFAAQLHRKGIEHRDLNVNNILTQRTADGSCRFQLIDINRMRFHARPLSMRRCMIDLRRLACPAPAFLYLLDRYAAYRGWNIDDTLLRGTLFRLLFIRRKQLKKRFRRHNASAAQKNRAGNLD